MTTEERALDTVARLVSNYSIRPTEELRGSLRLFIDFGDSRKHDLAVVLAALQAERESALQDACAALCRACKSARPGERFVTVDGRLHHFRGTVEYPGEGRRDLAVPCQAEAVRRLMGETG